MLYNKPLKAGSTLVNFRANKEFVKSLPLVILKTVHKAKTT